MIHHVVVLNFFFRIPALRINEGFVGDVHLSDKTVNALTELNPKWDEPLSAAQHSLQLFSLKAAESLEYNKSTLCRKSMIDGLLSLQNERVMLLSKEEFHSKKWTKKLPLSGAVLFVIDDPFHSTDQSIRCDNNILDDPRILAVAAEDSMCSHNKVFNLPIGMESKLIVGRLGQQALTTFMQLKENPTPTKMRRYNVQSDAHMHKFANGAGRYRDDRGDMEHNVQRSAIDDWYKRHTDLKSHFQNHVSQAKLSLCPEGNGMDTHRFYHNYALRTRCIVRKGYLSELHKEFPGTIVVDSWNEVTSENIKKWISEEDFTYDPKLVTSQYWISKFLEPHGITPSAPALKLKESTQNTKKYLGSIECSKPVVMVNVNNDFIKSGMFYNWYHYAEPFLKQAHAQLVMSIPDRERSALLRVKELDNNYFIMSDAHAISTVKELRSLQTERIHTGVPYGSQQYKDLMSERVEQIKSVLKKGCSVLHADIDTAWLENPFDDLNEINKNAPQPLILVSNSPNGFGKKKNKSDPPPIPGGSGVYCGCFMYMTPDLLNFKCDFFQKWSTATQKSHGNEQIGLNSVVKDCHKDSNFTFDVLPFDYYAPGPATSNKAHVVHANFVTGDGAKIAFLKKHNLWHPLTEEWLKGT